MSNDTRVDAIGRVLVVLCHAAIAGRGICVRPQNKGLETAWNGSGYFRQAMATLGVTLFVTTDDTAQIIEFGDSLE